MIRYRLCGFSTPFDAEVTFASLRDMVARRLRVAPGTLTDFGIERRALDCRKGNRPVHVWTVRFVHDDPSLQAGGLSIADDGGDAVPAVAGNLLPQRDAGSRPVVVGLGPAGLFAALALARVGMPPIILERGRPVRERARDVAAFWNAGTLDPESNVLFGEGGAGLYSDGKLTSRSKDRARERMVRESFVEWGAPEPVLYDAAAHLGTDAMHRLLARARDELVHLGCDIRHGSRLDDLHIEDGALRALRVCSGTETGDLATEACILAIGHSARDTYRMLVARSVALDAKPCAMGVRIEQPQERIDRCQYGPFAGHEKLGAASYRLTHAGERGLRDCYTFCMCPGGRVVACASSVGAVCSNGMSNAARNAPYGNAAFVVPVLPDDMGGTALGGLALQEAIESAVFHAGGETYALPASALGDVLDGRAATRLPIDANAPRPRCAPGDPLACFPETIRASLHAGIAELARRFPKLLAKDDLIYGAETRTSSPVRIIRNDHLESVSVRGLYPCGEGAGYAGGIISSAIDGLRAAEAVLARRC